MGVNCQCSVFHFHLIQIFLIGAHINTVKGSKYAFVVVGFNLNLLLLELIQDPLCPFNLVLKGEKTKAWNSLKGFSFSFKYYSFSFCLRPIDKNELAEIKLMKKKSFNLIFKFLSSESLQKFSHFLTRTNFLVSFFNKT